MHLPRSVHVPQHRAKCGVVRAAAGDKRNFFSRIALSEIRSESEECCLGQLLTETLKGLVLWEY